MSPLLPPNEPQRLAALERLSIFELPASPFLDRVCRIAQKLFHVPIAAVTFLDAERQWLKASIGVAGITSTAREHSFCQYTVMHDEVFVVPDARADRTFAGNPYVAGEPGIRFYAGTPLTIEPGIRLGSLCVIDTRPRTFEPKQAAILASLGRAVVDELWLQQLERNGLAADGPETPSGRAAPAFDLTNPLTSAQIRAGRAFLNWSVRELSEVSGVSATTIKRMEANGSDTVRKANVDAVRRTLEEHGIAFTTSSNGVALSIRPNCKD